MQYFTLNKNYMEIDLYRKYGIDGQYIRFNPSGVSDLIEGDMITQDQIVLRYMGKGEFMISSENPANTFITGDKLLKTWKLLK